jgi:hypothetical protein
MLKCESAVTEAEYFAISFLLHKATIHWCCWRMFVQRDSFPIRRFGISLTVFDWCCCC